MKETRVLHGRRTVFAALSVITFVALLLAMARFLGGDGLGPADGALLLCYGAMLPWNVLGFWNAAIGFAILRLARDPSRHVFPAARSPATGPIRSRVALVMPVHNEDPDRVLRHLEETVASLDATGEGAGFEVFLLSDTQASATAAKELSQFNGWRRRLWRPERVHYRRRADNLGHKTGNLWEFLETHGQRFDHMLVLDADSAMSGSAILRLVRIMDAHPDIGILQQLIVGLPSSSPFPRIFQFGMRHGMRAYTVGSAWWQGDCGPYWGHNALIRVAPFIAHCRLPMLSGRPPLGGRVLSHDQVEAVLMRRAGWQVRVLPEEAGSFEENPPTLSDFVKRDLRWCQGNWQYLQLIGRPGFHAMGRLQLLLALLMYVSGPAWMLFSLVGFGREIAIGMSAAPPIRPGALDPWLGVPAAWEGWALLATMMTIVFAPKLAGVAQVLLTPRLRRDYGGGQRVAVSTTVELVFSFILAPIMAFAQTILVLGMLAGRTIRWEAQLRDPRALPWAEAIRGLWPQSLFGLVLASSVWWLAPASARLWVTLFCGPLLLAVPFAVVTASSTVGLALARLGICAVPEEVDPPTIVAPAAEAPPAVLPAPRRSGFGAVEAPAAPPVD
jgi:membrane glycosyltransferase